MQPTKTSGGRDGGSSPSLLSRWMKTSTKTEDPQLRDKALGMLYNPDTSSEVQTPEIGLIINTMMRGFKVKLVVTKRYLSNLTKSNRRYLIFISILNFLMAAIDTIGKLVRASVGVHIVVKLLLDMLPPILGLFTALSAAVFATCNTSKKLEEAAMVKNSLVSMIRELNGLKIQWLGYSLALQKEGVSKKTNELERKLRTAVFGDEEVKGIVIQASEAKAQYLGLMPGSGEKKKMDWEVRARDDALRSTTNEIRQAVKMAKAYHNPDSVAHSDNGSDVSPSEPVLGRRRISGISSRLRRSISRRHSDGHAPEHHSRDEFTVPRPDLVGEESNRDSGSSIGLDLSNDGPSEDDDEATKVTLGTLNDILDGDVRPDD